MLVCLTLAMTPAMGTVAGTPSMRRVSVFAAVPYMGWNTYYGVGGIFDEHTILSVAQA